MSSFGTRSTALLAILKPTGNAVSKPKVATPKAKVATTKASSTALKASTKTPKVKAEKTNVSSKSHDPKTQIVMHFYICALDKTQTNIIGRTDLIATIQKKTSFKKDDIDTVLGAFVEVLKEDVLTVGREVRIRDFGTFKQKNRPARTGRNPKTGEPLQIASSKSLSFKASATGMKLK